MTRRRLSVLGAVFLASVGAVMVLATLGYAGHLIAFRAPGVQVAGAGYLLIAETLLGAGPVAGMWLMAEAWPAASGRFSARAAGGAGLALASTAALVVLFLWYPVILGAMGAAVIAGAFWTVRAALR